MFNSLKKIRVAAHSIAKCIDSENDQTLTEKETLPLLKGTTKCRDGIGILHAVNGRKFFGCSPSGFTAIEVLTAKVLCIS